MNPPVDEREARIELALLRMLEMSQPDVKESGWGETRVRNGRIPAVEGRFTGGGPP
jgi:hypothetical protein